MTSLWDVLLPMDVLIRCLNAALAPIAACAIAIALNRRPGWSLPVRHALLVAAIAISLTAPLMIPLFDLPSVWSIRVPETVDQLAASAAIPPVGVTDSEVALEPPVTTSVPVTEVQADQPAMAEPAAVPLVTAVSDPTPTSPLRGQRSLTNTDWLRLIGTLLCGVWLVGLAAGTMRAILGVTRFRRWMQTVSVAESPTLLAAARRASDALGLRREIAVHHSEFLPAPVTFGLIHPRIVVPVEIESTLPSDQLLAVLQHEMAHIARRDLWIGLLQQLTQVGYWWNPLVRAANRQLADLREQICDDIAIRQLAEPGAYAATLIAIAQRCSQCAPVPATLGIGSSPAGQLEARIRRIVSPRRAACIRLSRRAAAGVSAAAVLMAATILFAQVQIESSAVDQSGDRTKTVSGAQTEGATEKVRAAPSVKTDDDPNPTLHDLIQEMAAYERMYFPFDVEVMETFRFPDDLTPQERAKNLRADGRKHQRLMEYAQLAKRIWRSKETDLVDDEIEQGPYERFSDGDRIVQRGPSSVTINGVTATEYYINGRKRHIEHYLSAAPLLGVFCLSQYGAGELFSEAFKDDEEAVELAWDNGDAKLTFAFGKPHWNTQYVLWLSRAHAWHPIRWQRYWDAKDEFWFDEWEVTKFVPHGKLWRVAEGTHRYRELKDRKSPDPKIKYSMDFKVLSEKYGSDVDEKQFRIEIPPGAKVREEGKPEDEPPPLVKTREITVTVVDVDDKPIPQASVKLPASRLRDYDLMTTDEQGVARSAKAPADNVTMQITAAGFRPVTWIMVDVNELRAIMVPVSPGVVVDEQGKPVADAWITNGRIQMRADGITYVPHREWDGRDEDWSGTDGRFELKSDLTLRRRDAVVPFIAVNPESDKMTIRFVPASELGEQQKLVLQPVCDVHGHCLLLETTELVNVGVGLETSEGTYIGSISARRAMTPDGLRIDFEIRLPPGEYMVMSPQTSHHAGFRMPFTVVAGQKDLDLGTKAISPTGTVALKGKPAPELGVQWRPGQQTSWEKLRGKVVVLDFWGTWCGPCVSGMPQLMEIAEQFQDKPVAWLSIHTPNLKEFDEFDREVAKCEVRDWNKKKLPFTTVLDHPLPEGDYSGQTSKRYGVAEWPTLIVVDQQGKVVGPIHQKKLAETISRLLDRGTE